MHTVDSGDYQWFQFRIIRRTHVPHAQLDVCTYVYNSHRFRFRSTETETEMKNEDEGVLLALTEC